MTAGTITPYRPDERAGRDGFAQLLRAEWTKFRTVRGWLIGMVVAALLTVGVGLLGHSSCAVVHPGGSVTPSACPAPPSGPGGEAVTDSFYFVHQPLAAGGSVTVRVTSLTGRYSSGAVQVGTGLRAGMRNGLQPWAKAGIIIKENTRQGSAYTAIMVTGSHGVRMQYNYTQDTAGIAGPVSAAAPRWLRLTRSGDKLTGYESADGTHWSVVGTATLAGLSSTVQAGLFAASPASSTMSACGAGGQAARGPATLSEAAPATQPHWESGFTRPTAGSR